MCCSRSRSGEPSGLSSSQLLHTWTPTPLSLQPSSSHHGCFGIKASPLHLPPYPPAPKCCCLRLSLPPLLHAQSTVEHHHWERLISLTSLLGPGMTPAQLTEVWTTSHETCCTFSYRCCSCLHSYPALLSATHTCQNILSVETTNELAYHFVIYPTEFRPCPSKTPTSS